MKKVLFMALVLIMSCSDSDTERSNANNNITFTFAHTWDQTPITNNDFSVLQYTNANGETLSIERLRYLISDITFTTPIGEELVLSSYFLVDVNNTNLSFNPFSAIPPGVYSNVSFTFGFNNEDNAKNYPDLNSVSFNVPEILGGGYHYMQLDGKFINSNAEEQGYNYHTIRAVDNTGANLTFPQDTFFRVNLGEISVGSSANITIKMNVAEWFKNPNQWDLNQLNSVLMPNASAQIMMSENGRSVFSLGNVTQ